MISEYCFYCEQYVTPESEKPCIFQCPNCKNIIKHDYDGKI